ncbi:MAG: ECF transporter S component [Eubacteriales bacterium]
MTNSKTKYMVRIAVLSAIAFIFMYLEIGIPIFPGFLKFDFSDITSLLGAFSMGPLAGVLIQLFKNILIIAIKGSYTGGVGELANFFIGSAWMIPVALIYKRSKTRKNAVLSLAVGAVSMVVVAALANYFILLPFYAKIMPVEAIIEMGAVINAKIDNFFTLVLYGITPFNIFKTAAISIITVLIYKKVSPILHD